MVLLRQTAQPLPPTISIHPRPAGYGGQGREHQPGAVLPPTMSWREFCAWPAVQTPALARLSPAERVVAMQVAQGLSNREIAMALGKSEFTVKHQVSAILQKLGVPSRGRLIFLLR
ncbi:MAG TPA: LuxR C-terminal-related transcriptional regulator [Opitutaceae bacterium]|nr:LuxR C-terminal-related transcriptional regulator [Opitutaceae bacterium]